VIMPRSFLYLVAASALAVAVVTLHGFTGSASMAEKARVVPTPAVDETTPTAKSEVAVFAGGCFWGVQGVYQHVKGVTNAVSGYAGGEKKTAEYEVVGTGSTGHAESVQVTFDPRVVSYGRLLQIFFSVAHDPTQRGGQGPDRGPQYRSVVFVSSARQEEIAKAYIEQLTAAHVFKDSITTQVVHLVKFYPAEDYHQDFARKNPNHRYIQAIDMPKVEDLRREFAALYVK